MNSVDLPSIPIQPVSMATAAMLLSNLTGIPADGSWVGGLNVTYNIGLTGESKAVILNFQVSFISPQEINIIKKTYINRQMYDNAIHKMNYKK